MAAMHHQSGALAPPAASLDVLLSAIPSLPRPVLARLTTRLIERMDALDGDPDLEDDTADCCSAGDDGVFSGPAFPSSFHGWRHGPSHHFIGYDEDCEREQMIDDVPNLKVWSIEPAEDGKRVLIDMSGERWIGSVL